jgi:hypothetical protein
VELIRQFPHERMLQALDGWRWLPGLAGLRPWFASPFGDLFLQDDAGAVWYLDLIEGSVARTWDDAEACWADVRAEDGMDRYLLAALVEAADEKGVVAGEAEVLYFKIPPLLGGPMTADDVQTIDFVVGVDLAGQLHEQVKDLPPGTQISGIEIR